MGDKRAFPGFLISWELPPTSGVLRKEAASRKTFGTLGWPYSGISGTTPLAPQVIALGKPAGLGGGERDGQWDHTSDS